MCIAGIKAVLIPASSSRRSAFTSLLVQVQPRKPSSPACPSQARTTPSARTGAPLNRHIPTSLPLLELPRPAPTPEPCLCWAEHLRPLACANARRRRRPCSASRRARRAGRRQCCLRSRNCPRERKCGLGEVRRGRREDREARLGEVSVSSYAIISPFTYALSFDGCFIRL